MNGGGRIEREYGPGRGRTDLLIVWPRGAGRPAAGESGAGGSRTGGRAARVDQVVIECKVRRGSLERTLAEGLEQTAAYMTAAPRRRVTS